MGELRGGDCFEERVGVEGIRWRIFLRNGGGIGDRDGGG